MKMIRVEASCVIDAPREMLYAIVRDYAGGHNAILPKPYFSDLQIEKGGVGAGTEYRMRATVYGQSTDYHHRVSEPEPGRVIRESDMETPQWSSFTFDELSPTQTRVTITSEMPRSGGIKGVMESLFTPGIVRRIFLIELDNLAAYAAKQRAATA
ncbi:MAG: SRPBCC family protein [Blastochloris sp.]|nr:SRPBCC family protein [Blastochloris sp.]